MSATMKLKQYSVDTPRETIFQDATALLETIPKWKEGKTFFEGTTHETETKGEVIDDDFWVAAKAHFQDVNLERLRKAIIGTEEAGFSHSDYEPHYKHEISQVQVQGEQFTTFANGWSYKVRTEYSFSFPFSKRTFNQLVHVFVDPIKRWALIVSLPIKGPLFPDSVLGEAVTVEELSWKAERDGPAEWLIASTSGAGGNIPHWASNYALAGILVKDVPNVVDLISGSDYFTEPDSKLLSKQA
ncbi:uncharacterized protein LODBEIA_P41760 [Lodderomyces beijingensis]|uniref:DUF3074 domain-containing protein n=1 Tax=Lodderomyces beijingensis TaxID=1775926 RepID=A0ABP0ZRH3_9ASCO